MSDSLIDADARLATKTSSSRRMFVEAGAGSGKTHELKTRIIELVASGKAEFPQIAAITFTEAAAAELKDRVRHGMEEEANGGDKTRAERCAHALNQLDDGYVGTIHGWARRLLQAHFLEAGLTPEFEVMDSTRQALDDEALWVSFVARYLTMPSDQADPGIERLFRGAFSLGMTLTQLRNLLDALAARWERAGTVPSAGTEVPVPDVSLIARAWVPLAEIASTCLKEDDKLLLDINRMAEWIERLGTAGHAGERFVVEMLAGCPFKVKVIGNQNNWRDVKTARALRNEFVEAVDQAIEPVRTAVLRGVLYLLARHVVDAADARRRTGQLQFHDLLVFVNALLAGKPEVLAEVQAGCRYLFVDEYQDTDPLQANIVDLVASGDKGASVFTVGDPRQSIYRFRGADVEQYERARILAEEEVGLRTNFRTVGPIVDWVSGVSLNLSGVKADELNRLAAARVTLDGTGTVEIFGQTGETGIGSAEIRRIEADEVAERIARLMNDGLVVHGDDGPRCVNYRDIAILMPTRVALPATRRALRERGIPFRVESRSLVWATQEVRDLIALLSSIDNPDDPIALIAALTTPALGCSDEDLLSWRRASGTWDYRVPGNDDSRVGVAFAWLRSMHEARWNMNVAQLVDRILEDRRMFELAYLQDRQREPWHRLRFVQDKAHRWMTDAGDTTLGGFLRWARIQLDKDADTLETIVPESDDDAVRIMTIHAAKGLEFPVVFLTGINSSSNNTNSALLKWTEDGFAVRIGPQGKCWGTPGFADVIADDVEAEREERNRLLYVALTRARDHAFVSVHQSVTNASKKSSPTMATSLSAATANVKVPEPPITRLSRRAPGSPPEPALRSPEEWAGDRARVVASSRRPLLLSASAVNRAVEGEPSTPLEGPSREERMSFGSAVHWALEHAAFDADDDEVRTLVAKECTARALEHRIDDGVKAVRMAFASEPVCEAVASGMWKKEAPVATSCWDDAGHGIYGTLDLCYLHDGKWRVVDYKTDELAEIEKSDRLLTHYQWQLLVYASALQEATGIEVERASLLLIDPNQEHAIVRSIVPDAKKHAELQAKLDVLFSG